MKKIVFIVACHNRVIPFGEFIINIKYLSEYFDVKVVVCTSSEEVAYIARSNGFEDHFEIENFPIGRKRNKATREAKKHEADLYIQSAEDHLISKGYIEYALRQIEIGCDLVGTWDEYFYDYSQNIAKYCKGYQPGWRYGEVTGIGKCFSRRLLNALDWQVVPDEENTSLDFKANQKLSKIPHKAHFTHLSEIEGAMLVDLKDGTTLNKIEDIPGEVIDTEVIFKHFPNSTI